MSNDAPVADWVTIPDLHRDPFPIYERLRSEGGVHWVPQVGRYPAQIGGWVFRGTNRLRVRWTEGLPADAATAPAHPVTAPAATPRIAIVGSGPAGCFTGARRVRRAADRRVRAPRRRWPGRCDRGRSTACSARPKPTGRPSRRTEPRALPDQPPSASQMTAAERRRRAAITAGSSGLATCTTAIAAGRWPPRSASGTDTACTVGMTSSRLVA